MTNKKYFDERWIGSHGIGRFAKEVAQRLPLKELKIPGAPTSSLDPFRFSLALNSLPKESVAFSPGFNVPAIVPRNFVFTIHDLNHLDRQDNTSFLKKLYYRIFVLNACNQAFKVLTVSNFSKQRICSWSGINSDKVEIVGNGVGQEFKTEGIKFDFGCPYVLFVGNRKGHKNEKRLLEAYAKSHISSTIRLVLTGESTPDLIQIARDLNIGDKIHFLGKVPDNIMPDLYRGATAFIFPSLYEGFGLPVIEAMACGTPVLTSNVTALPEVAGDAALLVDPTDTENLASAIRLIVNDQPLRSTLIERGLQRSKLYNWDNVATKVKNVLLEAHAEVNKK